MATILEQAMGLSVDEKLDLISALWDSMTRDPEKLPAAPWQVKELKRRLDAQRDEPQPDQSWDEVKREIRHGKA